MSPDHQESRADPDLAGRARNRGPLWFFASSWWWIPADFC